MKIFKDVIKWNLVIQLLLVVYNQNGNNLVNASQANLLNTKVAFSSKSQSGMHSQRIVDNDLANPFILESGEKTWIAVDLVFRSEVTKVHFYLKNITYWKNWNGFEIAVGDNYVECTNDTIGMTLKACATIKINKNDGEYVEIPCSGIGRFVIVRSTWDNTKIVGLNELNVFGSIVNDNKRLPSNNIICTVNTKDYLRPITVLASSDYDISYLPTTAKKIFDNDYTNEFHSKQIDGRHWIAIDLGKQSEVNKIRFYPIKNYLNNFNGYEIAVVDNLLNCINHTAVLSITPCATIDIKSFKSNVIDVTCSGIGRFVIVRAPEIRPEYLSLHELAVFGSYTNNDKLSINNNPCKDILKPIAAYLSSSYYGYHKPELIIDHDYDTMFYSENKDDQHWAAVDLGRQAKVTSVRIYIARRDSSVNFNTLNGYEVAVGDNLLDCLLHDIKALSFNPCAKINVTQINVDFVDIKCLGIGQFVIVRAPEKKKPYFGFNEISLFGSYANNEVLLSNSFLCTLNSKDLLKPISADYSTDYYQYQYSRNGSVKRIFDNKYDETFYSVEKGRHWVAVDLGRQVTVNRVRIYFHSVWNDILNGYEIIVGDNFLDCKSFIATMPKIIACGKTSPPQNAAAEFIDINCSGTGRFVIVLAKAKRNNYLGINELAVFGSYTNNDVPSTNIYSCTLNTADTLRRAHVYVSSTFDGNYNASTIIDRNYINAFWTKNNGRHWVAIDFGEQASVSSVRFYVQNNEWRKWIGYEIGVGDNFLECMNDPSFSVSPCAIIDVMQPENNLVEIQCSGTGRYVVVRAPGIKVDSIRLDELFVYGIPNKNPSPNNNFICTSNTQGLLQPTAAYISSNYDVSKHSAKQIIDKNYMDHFYSEYYNRHWVAVDLGKQAKIDKVRVYTDQDDNYRLALEGYEVAVGDNFNFDKCQKDIATLPMEPCAKIQFNGTKVEVIDLACKGVGRFVIVRRSEKVAQDNYLALNELVVFGSLTNNDMTASNNFICKK